jgi:hypothetical protein
LPTKATHTSTALAGLAAAPLAIDADPSCAAYAVTAEARRANASAVTLAWSAACCESIPPKITSAVLGVGDLDEEEASLSRADELEWHCHTKGRTSRAFACKR